MKTPATITIERNDRIRVLFVHELTSDERDHLLSGEVPLTEEELAAMVATVSADEFAHLCRVWADATDGEALLAAYYDAHPTAETRSIVARVVSPMAADLLVSTSRAA
jgi:hypothetical protein